MAHRLARSMGCIALVLISASAPATRAAGGCQLRSPQVAFDSAPLQAVLDANDGAIHAQTDQLDDPHFAVSFADATPRLLARRAFGPASNSIGIYTAPDSAAAPTRYPVLPANLPAGWFAQCVFPGPGRLTVLLFDANAVFQGSTAFGGFDRTVVGWYLQTADRTCYSQDALNGDRPQMLTFAGTGPNALRFWQCFEGSPSGGASTFATAVVEVDPDGAGGVDLCATPVRRSTWGGLKATYR